MIGTENRGYVLVTALLMLLVLTVIGIAAIGTSTIENLLSGNIRLRESNISQADGCAELSKAVIGQAFEQALFGAPPGLSRIMTDTSLPTELLTMDFDIDGNTDAVCAAGSISVDIDKMYSTQCEGSGGEMFSGYEGQGKGYATTCAYYRINSSSTDLLGSTGTVGSIYKYITK